MSRTETVAAHRFSMKGNANMINDFKGSVDTGSSADRKKRKNIL